VLKKGEGTRKYIFFSLLKILLVEKIATIKALKSNIKRAAKALSKKETTPIRATAKSTTIKKIKKAPRPNKEVKSSVKKTVSRKSSTKTTSNARTSKVSAKPKTVKASTKTVKSLAKTTSKAASQKPSVKGKATKAKPKIANTKTVSKAKTSEKKVSAKTKTTPKKKTKAAAKKTTWILTVGNSSQFENLQKAIQKSRTIDEISSTESEIKVKSSKKSMEGFRTKFKKLYFSANLNFRQL